MSVIEMSKVAQVQTPWLRQIIVNPDGLGSYLNCDIPGIFLNKQLDDEIKKLAELSGNLRMPFSVYDIDGENSISCITSDESVPELVPYLAVPTHVLIHFGPHFI